VDALRLASLLPELPRDRTRLLDNLGRARREVGPITMELSDAIADHMGIRRGEVHEVVSFYSFLQVPTDAVRVCTGPVCDCFGARELLASTPGSIEVACLGHCDLAPAMTRGDEIVPAVSREAQAASEAGAIVVATQDWHPESTPHFAKDGGPWPVHCVAGTWGAELHQDLVLPDDAPRVRKGANGEDGYSGFTMRDPVSGETIATELEALLRDAGVERVVVVGLATDYCVKATALDAVRLGFATEVLTDAIAAVNVLPDDGERALIELRDAGVALTAAVSS